MSVDRRCHAHVPSAGHAIGSRAEVTAYDAFILAGYLQWCTAQRLDALRDIAPRVVERWITVLRGRGYAPNTIVGRVSAVSAFYRWCVREQLIDRNPIDAIRRPVRPTVSTTISLTRHELTDWLAAAERRGGAWWAAAMLLGLNGLRCGELIACDVTDVGSHSWHHTLALRTTKGDRPTVVPTMQALDAAIGGRMQGQLLSTAIEPSRATHDRVQRAVPRRRWHATQGSASI